MIFKNGFSNCNFMVSFKLFSKCTTTPLPAAINAGFGGVALLSKL